MRTIGLIGGMSWESSAIYYRLINEAVAERIGGHHSAKLIMISVDFAEIEAMQRADDWEASGRLLADVGARLEEVGADAIVVCTNTMHRVAGVIGAAISVPLIHIADATAAAIKADGLARIGLLGTRYTMEADFYAGRLRDQHGLDVIVPDEPGRELVHRVIYEELTLGQVRAESRSEYIRIAAELGQRGAECVVLGCTEIGMLLSSHDLDRPAYDTTELHAAAAVDFALGG